MSERDSVLEMKQLEIEVRERFLFAIDLWAPDTYRYKWLEEATGIPGGRWQHVTLEKQMPTLEMLIAIGKYTHYLHWIVTGADSAAAEQQPPKEIFEQFQSHRQWIKTKRGSLT